MSTQRDALLDAAFGPDRADDERLLARVALPRRLDDAVLAVLDTGVTLGELAGRGFTEPVPGAEETVRVRPAAREWQLERWLNKQVTSDAAGPGFAALNRDLAAHFEAAKDWLEALYHLLAADAKAAGARFRELYDAADAEHDLPACRDLLDTLESAARIAGAEAQALHDEYLARFDARGMWVDDWYRSARFLQPEASHEPIRALLEGEPRVLQLWARGGMGKTIQLRHLIARTAVPRGIACARVDFDDVAEPALALEQPWLVLLEVAGQLNAQLPGAPFFELLRQYRPHRERLRRPAGELGTPKEEGVVDDEATGAAVTRAVLSTIAELPDDRRVLVVLDTLEVPLLAGSAAAEASLQRLLEALRPLADAHAVRLILSGRYDLRDRVPSFDALFADACPLHLDELAPDEARRYLLEPRGLPDSHAIGEAVRLAGGVPFKLALLADVIQGDPDVSAQHLRRFQRADLAYLVLRVLDRIEPAPRWVLRYGAVPRVLDRAFLERVMAPVLEAGMRGDLTLDDPGLDDLPSRRPGPTFPADLLEPGEKLDFDALWTSLARYAGEASWVTHAGMADAALRLHPDVSRPMRALLAERGVLWERLQRDAAEYFAERARAEPARRAQWLKEVVFHRFQLEGPAAAATWRELLRAADGPGGAEERLTLARDLLGEDYLDEDEPRSWRDGVPILDDATLHEARFEAAWARIQKRTRSGLAQTRPGVAAARRTVGRLAPDVGPIVGEHRLAMVAAVVDLLERDLDAARRHLNIALEGDLHPDDRVWLLARFGEALTAVAPSEALHVYAAALEHAASTSSPDAWRETLELDAAELATTHDRLDLAIARLERLADVEDISARERVNVSIAELRLRAGYASRAGFIAQFVEYADDPVVALRARTLVTRSALALGRVSEAATALERVDELMQATASGADSFVIAATATELRGEVATARLEGAEAAQAFAEATRLWRRAEEEDRAVLCAARGAASLLHDLGSVRAAATILDSAGRAEPGSDAYLETLVLRAELAHRGREDTTAERLAALARREAADAGSAPHTRVMVELGLLAAGATEDAREALHRLPRHLSDIHPPLARLPLLARLRGTEPLSLEPSDGAALERLSEVVPSLKDLTGEEHLGPDDVLALALVLAEVHRVMSSRDGAAAYLGFVLANLDLVRTPSMLRRALDAVVRLDPDPELVERFGLRPPPDTLDRLTPDFPVDAAIFSLATLCAPRTTDVREATLRFAANRLARASSGRYVALAELASAKQSLEAGERNAAAPAVHRAVAAFSDSGDLRAAERFTPPEQVSYPVETAPGDDDEAPSVHIELRGDRLISWTGSGRPRGALEVEHAVASAFAGRAERGSRRETFPRELWDILAGPPDRAGRSLADALPLARAPHDPGADVALRLLDSELHALPWEGARDDSGGLLTLALGVRSIHRVASRPGPSRSEIRAAQLALAERVGALKPDGVLGPRTVDAIERFQRQAGLAVTGGLDSLTFTALHDGLRPSVLIVRPPRYAEERSRRGSRSAGTPLELLYESARFEIDVVEAPQSSEMPELFARCRPGLVHIAAGFVDDSGAPAVDAGGAGDDLQSSVSSQEALGLTPAVLSSALEVLDPRALVILDPPEPRGSYETIGQLLLRNAFAAELYATDAARAVLGLGLVSFEDQERLYSLIVRMLGDGAPLGQVVHAVQERGNGRGRGSWGFSAPVLYARSGDLRGAWRK